MHGYLAMSFPWQFVVSHHANRHNIELERDNVSCWLAGYRSISIMQSVWHRIAQYQLCHRLQWRHCQDPRLLLLTRFMAMGCVICVVWRRPAWESQNSIPMWSWTKVIALGPHEISFALCDYIHFRFRTQQAQPLAPCQCWVHCQQELTFHWFQLEIVHIVFENRSSNPSQGHYSRLCGEMIAIGTRLQCVSENHTLHRFPTSNA